jgi:hypothetical protein
MFFQSTSFAEKPYGSNNSGKYSHELGTPLSSRIGVELGLEKVEQLVGPTEIRLGTKFQELQNEIESVKKSLDSASTSSIPNNVRKNNSIDNPRRITLMSTFFLMMLSGCFPLIVQTFTIQPFPSPILTISSMLAVFSIAALVVINWKR